ncbi:MAG TPA: hypothetical protein VGL15_08800 [Vicinamibacteria bacterium]|jgi:hypothetical protein
MNGRLAAAAAAGLFVAVVAWMRTAVPGPASPAVPAPASPVPARAQATPEWPVVPARNPFVYAEGPVPPPTAPDRPRPAPRADNPIPMAPSPSAPPVKLIGLLRQGRALKAVLQVRGEVLIVAAGGEAGDYEVVSIDEDRGVRLRGRGGEEWTLPPPGT